MEDVTNAARRVIPRNPAGTQGYAAMRDSAALVRRPLGILRLSGKDPTGMLDAVLTNDVPKAQRAGVYALLLDPKGRIQTDLRVLKRNDSLLIVTEPEGLEAAETILGRYAPFSRVKVERLHGWSVLGLYGPEARRVLGVQELAEHETAELSVGGVSLAAAGVEAPAKGYDLILPPDALDAVEDHLTREGAVPADPADYETLRVEAGVPRFGGDLTPENFPGESGVLHRAVNFRKGCYPGQETVARMHYRGSPNKTLRSFAVEGPPPEPGEDIFQGEKRVGRLTSVSPLRPNGETLALGYLARSADAAGPLGAGEASLTPR
jgi:folate-binding protein YgfZ